MYPTYSLEVYDHVQSKWVSTIYEASNRPHHYDNLRYQFERLVKTARTGSTNQKPIGYRIMRDGSLSVDRWDNGKVA